MASRRTKYTGPIAPPAVKNPDLTTCNPNTGHKWEGPSIECKCGKMTRPAPHAICLAALKAFDTKVV